MKEVTNFKEAKTFEDVNDSWLRYVDFCEFWNVDWVSSELPTLNQIIKERKRPSFVNCLLGGYDKDEREWMLNMMIDICENRIDTAQYRYDTYRLDYLHYRAVYGGGLTSEEKAERDTYSE